MDVIPWAIGLVAGLTLPSLPAAIVVGAVSSLGLHVWQYFFTDPRVWGQFPEDLFGAAAMIGVTAIFAWVGSIVRHHRTDREVSP